MATLNDRSIKRINFHLSQSEAHKVRLATLKPDTKEYARCEAAMNKDLAFAQELRTKLNARLEAGKSVVGKRTGESFVIVVGDEPTNDIEFEYAGNKGAPGHRFDLVG